MLNAIFKLPQQQRLLVMGVMTALILGFVNLEIFGKESIIRNGTTMLLRIAPRDPRSLMQGDFMALRYSMAAAVASEAEGADISNGRVVVSLGDDEEHRGVAAFERLYEGQSLTSGQYLLRFRKRGDSVRLASDAYFFEEGEWQTYSGARFGELRVDDDGNAVLIALRDADLERIGPALQATQIEAKSPP